MTQSKPPFSLRAYRSAASLAKPLAKLALSRRLKAGKEDPARIGERQGEPGQARPSGPLVWLHGASVGESLSVLPLIERLSTELPETNFLVTTGTVTSAGLMEERLPPRAIHQYVPVDQPHFVRSFLDHWRPDAALFVESELWPSLIGETRARGVPMALVNGRLSPKSFESWQPRADAARSLLDAFDIVLGQDTENARRLATLSGRQVPMLGNLKQAADALPADEAALDALRRAIGERPVWVAASTHAGEEEAILDAHQQLSGRLPDLLTVIAPRHPGRGAEVQALCAQRDLPAVRRGTGALPGPEHALYVADTLGELGLFYRTCDVAFIGGSLVKTGGHNPLEPARLSCAIITGPHLFNFQDTYAAMRSAGGSALVRNGRDLSASLLRLMTDPVTREEMARHAREWADDAAAAVLDDVIHALRPVLEQAR